MNVVNENSVCEWETPFALEAQQIEAYQNHGFVKILNLFSTDAMQTARHEIIRLAGRLGSSVDKQTADEEYPSKDIDLYRSAFTQVFNLWTHSDLVRSFISGRLATVASELMGVDGVRVYHDQALVKEPGGIATPWHMDHYYWPLATEKVLTAWIPLVPVSAEMGPLDFAMGSQKMNYGRNEELVQLDERIVETQLADADHEIIRSPYALGEVSFHQGWTFHRAGANHTHQRREVFTVIYMDQNMTLQQPANANQEFDREKWCPGIGVGEIIGSEINPKVS